MKSIALLMGSTALVAGSSFAQQINVITFDDRGLSHGDILSGNEYSDLGLTFQVDSGNGLDTALIFDTTRTNTADPDLEDPFSGGNAQNTTPGNIIVIADSIDDPNNDGDVLDPSDSAAGGTLSLFFTDENAVAFGVTVLDAPEDTTAEDLSFKFYDVNGLTKEFSAAEFVVESGTQGADFGDNKINTFALTKSSSFGLGALKQVDLTLVGSGSFDSITWATPVVPEPSSALLAAAGLGFGLLRRRR